MKNLTYQIVLGFPRSVLLLFALLAAAAAWFSQDVFLDASADSLVLENDQSLAYYRKIAQRYETDEFLVITYQPVADLFADETLGSLSRIKAALSGIEGVSSVVTLLDVPLFSNTDGSMADKVRLATTLTDPAMDRERARKEILNSPIYRELLISKDGKITAIQVNLQRDEHYYELLHRRNALRLKASEEGLTDAEDAELEEISNEFRAYANEAADDRARLIADVRQAMEPFRADANMFLGGVPMIASDMIDFIRSDLRSFGLAMLVFLAATLLLVFRQLRWMFWPLFCAGLVVLLMFGFLGFMKWPVTVISSNFVSLLLILCVSFTIHITVRYQDLHAEKPDVGQLELVREAVHSISVPCLYSALTTLVAFGSLLVSGIRPVIDFGMTMALGIMVAFVTVFLVMPAGQVLMSKTRPVGDSHVTRATTEFFAAQTERHGGAILLASLVLLAACVAGMLQLKVENRFIDYFRPSTEIYQGMIVIDENLGGTTPLDIVIDRRKDGPVDPEPQAETGQGDQQARADDGWEDDPFLEAGAGSQDQWADDPFLDKPAAPVADERADDPFLAEQPADDGWGDDPFLAEESGAAETAAPAMEQDWFTIEGLLEVERVHDYLDSLPESGKVMSLALLPKLLRELNDGKMLNEVELAFLRALMPAGVKDTLVRPYLSEDGSQTRFNLRVRDSEEGLQRNLFLQGVETDLKGELGFAAWQPKLTGVMVLYNNMLQSLFRSQILTLGFVFCAILLMFLVLFRSLSLALIALFPNMLAASSVLGLMGWMGIPLDMMTITIAAITVGIAVDNTIHYVHRFMREFPKDRDYIATMHRCHASIGRAMYYVSLTIIVGFSILVLSNFVPTVYFGLFTAMAMVVALLFSLTLLPQLMVSLKPLGRSA